MSDLELDAALLVVYEGPGEVLQGVCDRALAKMVVRSTSISHSELDCDTIPARILLNGGLATPSLEPDRNWRRCRDRNNHSLRTWSCIWVATLCNWSGSPTANMQVTAKQLNG